ncbi:hypothetical protein ACFL3N_00680 [Candidatus Omnitrophota bacterium]
MIQYRAVRRITEFTIFILLITFGAGCSSPQRRSDLNELYTRSTTYPKPKRNPVIVIPGLLGSRLRDSETGTVVWGAFSGVFANPQTAQGARLASLPMEEGVPLRELKDSVISDGALDKLSVNVFFMPIRLNAYFNILKILGVGGYRDEDLAKSGTVKYPPGHFTSFQFDYDWRRDIVENAKLLDEFLKKERRYVQSEVEKRFGIKNHDVKFNLVAHSMGGLIARYYLRYGAEDLPEDGSLPETTWAGAKYIEKVVLVGTPNAGSIKAFTNLVEGFKGVRFIPAYSAAILGTMPSFYQLLPQLQHKMVVWDDDPEGPPVDIYDPELWAKKGWGLASPAEDRALKMLLPEAKTREERLRIALDHQKKCLQRARRVWGALNLQSQPPEHVSLKLFAGDAVMTPAAVSVNSQNSSIKVIKKAPGDGTVLRSSALSDERVGGEWSPQLVSPIKWRSVMFLFSDHMGMTEDPAFSDNILFYLLEQPD